MRTATTGRRQAVSTSWIIEVLSTGVCVLVFRKVVPRLVQVQTVTRRPCQVIRFDWSNDEKCDLVQAGKIVALVCMKLSSSAVSNQRRAAGTIQVTQCAGTCNREMEEVLSSSCNANRPLRDKGMSCSSDPPHHSGPQSLAS